MALIDDILKKTPGELADENSQAVSEAQSRMKVPSVQELQNLNAPDPDKPEGMSGEDFKYLSNYMPKEDIKRIYAPFDPNSGENYFQRLYASTQAKPQPIDEKKARNQRTIAGVAQGLGTLAQLFGASKGAYVKGGLPDVMGAEHQNEQNERNRYLQQSQTYNSGLLNSAVQDYSKKMGDYQNSRKAIQGILANKALREQQQAQFNNRLQQAYYKMAQDAQKNKEDREFKEKQLGVTAGHYKSMEGIAWQNANNNTIRTKAYIQKLRSGGGSGGYQVIIPANPNDPDAVTDDYGNRVRTFTLKSKGERDYQARNAKTDKVFLNSPEGKSIIKKRGGKNIFTGIDEPDQYIPDDDIAAAYIKYKYYDPQFKASKPSSQSQGNVVTQAPVWGAGSYGQGDDLDGLGEWEDSSSSNIMN